MSQKQEKKIRQLYRREFSHRMNETIGDLQRQMNSLLKLAPSMVPKKLWRRFQGLFLNI
jgi:hypothetical protein